MVALIAFSQNVFAGPGGHFMTTMFDSFWGKILLVALVIIFMPLIIWNKIKLFRMERRAQSDLQYLSQFNRNFDWLFAKGRVEACFNRVHQGWKNADLEDARHWMTDWYCQNQQKMVLDDWQAKGLENVCQVKEINNIRLIGVMNRNHDQDNEDSVLVVKINAEMQDYLQNKSTGEVVEGSKEYKNIGNIWVFRLVQGHWLVDRVDPAPSLIPYINLLMKEPDVRSTVSA
tara:strand:- start:1597 stop:2286 length:690 start_codon:yes stop_codon:yes gene_type:complete